MGRPSTRTEFIDYCKRQLGAPVLEINVADEQIEDIVDDAIQYYRDYHFDGTERKIKKFEITETIKENGQLDLTIESPSIIGVTRLFDIGDAIQSSNLFNIRYQIHLNDLFDFTSTTYLPYVTAMRHVEQLEEIFVGSQPIRFNRHKNQVNIDISKEDLISTTKEIQLAINSMIDKGLIKNIST